MIDESNFRPFIHHIGLRKIPKQLPNTECPRENVQLLEVFPDDRRAFFLLHLVCIIDLKFINPNGAGLLEMYGDVA